MQVNRRKLASTFGITLPTVDAWVEKGMPFETEGGLGREWVFDTKDCIAWWAEEQHRRRASAIAPPGQESYEEAERRKMVAAADKAELELARAAQLVVPIDEVAGVVLEENIRVRNRLLALPNELRPKALAVLPNDRQAAEGLVSAAEAIVLEAMEEIRGWSAIADVDAP